MDKLLIDVYTPGNGKSYLFQLNSSITVGAATDEMIRCIMEMEQGSFVIEAEPVILSDIMTRTRLAPELTLYSAGVRSGHRLLLV